MGDWYAEIYANDASAENPFGSEDLAARRSRDSQDMSALNAAWNKMLKDLDTVPDASVIDLECVALSKAKVLL